ncbi:MAG TPA: hypothetical protein VGP72_33645 [Planctomycetota bacterium]|jgi:hypothetical protein
MLEHRHQKVIPPHRFVRRLLFFGGIAAVLVALALTIGTLGYHFIAGFEWIDALLNASMILTGMGPVGELRTTAAKLFASAYAIFSGLVFISVMGVLLTPVVHRVMHKFHVEEK